MDEKQPLKVRIKNEKEKFMKLDSEAKKRYFRDYYLVPCVLILAAFIFVGWFLFDVFSSKKTVYSGATVGFLISDEGNEYMTSGFMNSLGKSYKRKKVELSRDTVMTLNEEAKNDQMQMEFAFTSQVTTGMFQFVIFNKANYEHYAGYDFYMPLDEYMNSEKYSSLEFLKGADGSAYGILLSDEVKSKIGYTGTDEIVFTLVYSNEHKNLNTPFIDYLFLGGEQ